MTLILGAGASYPYGYPLGSKLRDEILAANPQAVGDLYGPSENIPNRTAAYQISEFQQAFRYSTFPSIDRFLQIRRKYTDIGKFMIAHCMEQYEEIHPIENPRIIGGEDWYDYLYNRIMNPESPEDFSKNQLSIITFNYDTSLEKYLVTALQNSFGLNLGDTLVLLRDVPIIHIHGTLLGNRYDPKLMNFPTAAMAKGLKIVSEEISGSPELTEAHKCIAKAKSILFLGFGFHPINVKRLQIHVHGKSAILSGTIYGYEFSEYKADVEPLFPGLRFHYPRTRNEASALANDWTVYDFLRRNREHFH